MSFARGPAWRDNAKRTKRYRCDVNALNKPRPEGLVEKASSMVGVLKRRHREERKRRGDLIVYHQLHTTDEIAALPAVARNDRHRGLFQQAPEVAATRR